MALALPWPCPDRRCGLGEHSVERWPCPAQVGGEFAISTAEQRRQIDALKALESCMTALPPEQAAHFEGLSIRCGRWVGWRSRTPL